MNTPQIYDTFQPYYADRKEAADKPKPNKGHDKIGTARDHANQRKAVGRLKDELRKSNDQT